MCYVSNQQHALLIFGFNSAQQKVFNVPLFPITVFGSRMYVCIVWGLKLTITGAVLFQDKNIKSETMHG